MFFPRPQRGRPGPSMHTPQRGAVLIVGLIMLLLVTLLAVAAMRMSTTHVQVVANEKFRTEAAAAANYALDLAINSPTFTTAAELPALGAVSLQQGEHSSDAHALAVAYLPPQCQRYRYRKNSELVIENDQSPDANCLRTSAPSSVAIVYTDASGNADDNSLCVTTLWELGATASDPSTGTRVTVMQGVERAMEISDAENHCGS